MNKKLLVLHLNEFNLEFLEYGSKKYNCKYLDQILKYQKIHTFSVDKNQDKDLDPWVQSVTINTGKRSSDHKVYKIGQKINDKNLQIWDLLAKKNISCAVWGTMNTKIHNNKNLKVFFPDPWNKETETIPKELSLLYELPRIYARNYTSFSIFKSLKAIFKFIIGFFKFGIYKYFFKNIYLFTKILFLSGVKNYFLFFTLDIFSLKAFQEITYKKECDFSLIFLNSLAHFQHNNWDEEKNYWKYFFLVNEICKLIIDISKKYEALIIFNGFTQKKIEPEYIIRIKNIFNFLKSLDIKFKKIDSNMTNGGFIFFENHLDLINSLKILQDYKVCDLHVFEAKQNDDLSIFFRIQIKALKNLNEIKDKKNQEIKKYLCYENEYHNYNNNLCKKDRINEFLDKVKFIKTTGKHISNGNLLYKKINILNKKIENKEIFNLIYSYYS